VTELAQIFDELIDLAVDHPADVAAARTGGRQEGERQQDPHRAEDVWYGAHTDGVPSKMMDELPYLVLLCIFVTAFLCGIAAVTYRVCRPLPVSPLDEPLAT
jgi:hypothetical protein